MAVSEKSRRRLTKRQVWSIVMLTLFSLVIGLPALKYLTYIASSYTRAILDGEGKLVEYADEGGETFRGRLVECGFRWNGDKWGWFDLYISIERTLNDSSGGGMSRGLSPSQTDSVKFIE